MRLSIHRWKGNKPHTSADTIASHCQAHRAKRGEHGNTISRCPFQRRFVDMLDESFKSVCDRGLQLGKSVCVRFLSQVFEMCWQNQFRFNEREQQHRRNDGEESVWRNRPMFLRKKATARMPRSWFSAPNVTGVATSCVPLMDASSGGTPALIFE